MNAASMIMIIFSTTQLADHSASLQGPPSQNYLGPRPLTQNLRVGGGQESESELPSSAPWDPTTLELPNCCLRR